MADMATRVHGVKTESASLPEARPAPADDASPLDAAQLAEAFALFSRASEELSTAYNALQAQVGQHAGEAETVDQAESEGHRPAPAVEQRPQQ